MTTPTPEEVAGRQLLYALVAAAFHVVVGVLVVFGAAVFPRWWTAAMGAVWSVVLVVGASRWRRTGLVLGLTIGLFVVWAVGTVVVSRGG